MVVPLVAAALIGGATSLISGFMGASAADRAAKAQETAANNSLALQREIYETNRADAMPWMEAGKTALGQYMGELGLSTTGADGQPFQSQFRETPGYQFQVAEGEKGVMNNLSALGMKNSGAALKALTRFRQGLADQTYGNYMSQLGGLAGTGQQQAAQNTTAGANYAANAGNTLESAGQARASGYMGAANAWQNSLASFSNQAGSYLGKLDNNWNPLAAANPMNNALAGMVR